MREQKQEQLNISAANLTKKLFKPSAVTGNLPAFDRIFPGTREQHKTVEDPVKLQEALSSDVARTIKELMDEGTEKSLSEALSKVRALRRLSNNREIDTPSLPEAEQALVNSGGKKIELKGAKAIEMHVLVKGVGVTRAALSEASFNMDFDTQGSLAQELGGRLATRAENLAVAKALLNKESKGTINDVERGLLGTYRTNAVRDLEGALDIEGRCIEEYDLQIVSDDCISCALVVLPLAESITPASQDSGLAGSPLSDNPSQVQINLNWPDNAGFTEERLDEIWDLLHGNPSPSKESLYDRGENVTLGEVIAAHANPRSKRFDKILVSRGIASKLLANLPGPDDDWIDFISNVSRSQPKDGHPDPAHGLQPYAFNGIGNKGINYIREAIRRFHHEQRKFLDEKGGGNPEQN